MRIGVYGGTRKFDAYMLCVLSHTMSEPLLLVKYNAENSCSNFLPMDVPSSYPVGICLEETGPHVTVCGTVIVCGSHPLAVVQSLSIGQLLGVVVIVCGRLILPSGIILACMARMAFRRAYLGGGCIGSLFVCLFFICLRVIVLCAGSYLRRVP